MTLSAMAALAALLLASGAADANPETASAPQPASDPCTIVAAAKYAQWSEKQVMIRQTNIYSDGTKKSIEAIFTENESYGHETGLPWRSANIVRSARAAKPPATLVKQMGLVDCRPVGPAKDTAQPATIYSYDYAPDSNASDVTGRIWIADKSGLPLRQELHQEKEAGHRGVPVAIAATFTYDDDVKVPTDAIRDDDVRRWLAQQLFLGTTTTMAQGGHGHAFGGGAGGGHAK